MSFSNNLRDLRKKTGLKQQELATRLHVSQQAIAKWENGKAEPNISTLQDIASVLNCTVNDLLGVSENEDVLDSSYRKTIRNGHFTVMENFNKMCSVLNETSLDRIHTVLYSLRRIQNNTALNESDKQHLFACIAELIGRTELYADRLRTAELFNEYINYSEQNKLYLNAQINVLKDVTQTVMPQPKPRKEPKIILPLFETPVSAGTGSLLYDETPVEWITVQRNEFTQKADYLLKIRGDSMEPKFYDGDIILIEQTQQLFDGEIGIFILNGESYIKKLGKGELISLNSAYSPIRLHEYDDIRCVGRVLDTINLE